MILFQNVQYINFLQNGACNFGHNWHNFSITPIQRQKDPLYNNTLDTKRHLICQDIWGAGKKCRYQSDTMNYELLNNEPQDHMHQDDDLTLVRGLKKLVKDEW